MQTLRAGLPLVIVSIALVGCVKRTLIPASTLPQLNGAHTTEVGSTTLMSTNSQGQTVLTSQPVVARSVAQVVTLAGNTAEIEGEFDAAVIHGTQRQVFRHPVIATIEDEQLVVRGSNRGRWSAPIAEVEQVEVRTANLGATAVVTTLALGAALGLGLIFIAGM